MQYYARRKSPALIALVAVLLFSLIACNNAKSNPDQSQDGGVLIQHVYDDPQFGSFSVEFPKAWNMTELKGQAGTADLQGSLFSMLTLQLNSGLEDCIKFQMDRTWMFYENVVEERGTYTKSKTELTNDNKQVDVYVDSSTPSDNVYLIYIYGKDDNNYYYGEVVVSQSVYDANKDTIENVMKSFKIN